MVLLRGVEDGGRIRIRILVFAFIRILVFAFCLSCAYSHFAPAARIKLYKSPPLPPKKNMMHASLLDGTFK